MSASRPRLIAIIMMLSACGAGGGESERYVLTGNDTNLFFETQLPTNPAKVDEIIAEVRSFGQAHGMDVLIARETLTPGDFNVSANSPTINLKAMHIASAGDTGVQIFAIVPDAPTPTDEAMVRDFVGRIKRIG